METYLRHLITSLLFLFAPLSGLAAPAGADLLFEYANTSYSLDDLGRAEDQVGKILRAHPDHPGALALDAFIKLKRKNRKAAEQDLERLIQNHPDSPYTRAVKQYMPSYSGSVPTPLRMAMLLTKGGRPEAALEKWRIAMPNGPAPGPLAYRYALLLKSLNKTAEAESVARILTRYYPGNLNYRLLLAETLAQRPNSIHEANAIFGQLTAYPALETKARSDWRELIMRTSEPLIGLPLAEQYLVRYPDDYDVIERRKQLTDLTAKQTAEAQTTPKAKVSAKATNTTAPPRDPELAKAEKLIEHGKNEAARHQLERILRRRPNQGEALGYLGLVELRQGNRQEARQLFQRASRLDDQERRGKWRSLAKTARYWDLLSQAKAASDAGQIDQASQLLHQAIKLDPSEATGLARLGDVLALRHEDPEAARLYRRALRIDPTNWAALHGLAELKSRRSPADAVRFLDSLTSRQRRKLGSEHPRLLAGALRDLADIQLADGRVTAARGSLRRALEVAPANPWVRFDLARLQYKTRGSLEGIDLFEQGLRIAPSDPEMHYAYALFLRSVDRDQDAIAQIDAIPEAQMSPKYRDTRLALLTRIQRDRALALYRKGKEAEAKKILRAAETPEALDSPLASGILAGAWQRLGKPKHAVQLLSKHLDRPEARDPDLQLDLIDALQAAHMHAAAHARIAQLWHTEHISARQTRELAKLDSKNSLAMAQQLLKKNDYEQSRRVLDQAIQRLPVTASLLYARARAARGQGDIPQALDDLLAASTLAPNNKDYRIERIELLTSRPGSHPLARQEVDDLLAILPENDTETRMRLIPILYKGGEKQLAQQLVGNMARRYSSDHEMLRRLARLDTASHNGHNALAVYRQALLPPGDQRDPAQQWADWADTAPVPVAEEVDTAMAQERRTLTASLDFGSRSATKGLSNLSALRTSIEGRQPLYKGYVFAHVEPTHLDAGTLNMANPRDRADLGTNLLCTAGCASLPGRQKADGVGLLFGYEDDQWRIDAGTTPIGFPVHYLIGGIRYKDSLGPIDWSIDLSRRPITSSLLSYAGTTDPNSGRKWGGVNATGLTLGLSHDDGGPWGVWSDFEFHKLSGQHVGSNDRFRLLAGTYYKWLREPDQRVSVSLNGMYWQHQHNLGEYTWGHGGYYSPKQYLSLSTALDWYGRNARWSWDARGSISRSQSKTDRAPYFPTDPALQARAQAISGTTGINPFYKASSGPGTGYSLEGALEYRVNRFLHIGGNLSIERSQDYAPNHGMLYLRLTDEPDLKRIPMPPKAPLNIPDY